jgi:HD-GYP domain-containing protein (c-di-GMP phosphodiesterase class II)
MVEVVGFMVMANSSSTDAQRLGIQDDSLSPPQGVGPDVRRFLDFLEETFGVSFALLDSGLGQIVETARDWVCPDAGWIIQVLEGVGQRRGPHFVADEDPVILLALPLGMNEGRRLVAVAPLVTRETAEDEVFTRATELIGLPHGEGELWVRSQPIWPPVPLSRTAKSVLRNWEAMVDCVRLRDENEQIAINLTQTYEEICLLHDLSQSLRLTRSDEDLARSVLDSLAECIPAQGLAIVYTPVAKPGEVTYKARTETIVIAHGDCTNLDPATFPAIAAELGVDQRRSIVVRNLQPNATAEILPEARQLIVIAMAENERVHGWIVAFNHAHEREFGSVEASLMASVASILGVHSGNRDLYRQQSEFLASVVRALTSAIDAKDPYTCGHSDRVARIAVQIAKHVGCEPKALHTIYMAGLLHDIGKIGISDAVLGKQGPLTTEEYDHIKTHCEKGYRILADIRQLSDILPAVLHHHEQWDGRGYPCELVEEQIPRIARILAVADSYDAMTSDRPYRKGMPFEKVADIFRNGRGKQWDPEIIDAFFEVAEEVRALTNQERANLTLNVQEWT